MCILRASDVLCILNYLLKIKCNNNLMLLMFNKVKRLGKILKNAMQNANMVLQKNSTVDISLNKVYGVHYCNFFCNMHSAFGLIIVINYKFSISVFVSFFEQKWQI